MANIYFLVEGDTEAKIYTEWLSYLIPEIERVAFYDAVDTRNYYLFNARGYPSIVNTHLPRAIEDINALNRYDYLVMCFDADEDTPQERIRKITTYLADNRLTLQTAKLVFIVQNRCIETWLLGNRRLFKRNPQNAKLLEYILFYDVSTNDPEKMGLFDNFAEHQQFHKAYFKLLCRERNIKYSERTPRDVTHSSYLEQLEKRVQETNHLATFLALKAFCDSVRAEIAPNQSSYRYD